MLIITPYTAAAVSEVLHREIPDLAINSITIIETGWDHLVAEMPALRSSKSEVGNGEWIFRFPRTESSIANLEREKRLLEYLKNHITLPIPYYQYSGTHTAFVGYRKIPGIHLNTQIYAGLTPAVRLQIAETLALFFTQLHREVSIKQALAWGYTYIIRPLNEIESDLIGTLPVEIATMVQQAITHARADLSKKENLVFCHQDVNGDNTAFNAATGKITGIFDFSDVGIAPYSLDFAELFNIDAELAGLAAEAYAKVNNVPSPLIGGATDYILRKATLMIEARKKGNAQDETSLLKGLSDFMLVWYGVLAQAEEN